MFVGIPMLVAAQWLIKSPAGSLFVKGLALNLSFCGHWMIYLAAFDFQSLSDGQQFSLLLFIQGIITFLIKEPIQRFCSAFASAILFCLLLEQWQVHYLQIVPLLAAWGYLTVNRAKWCRLSLTTQLSPIHYALTLVLLIQQTTTILGESLYGKIVPFEAPPVWLAELGLAVVAGYIAIHLYRKQALTLSNKSHMGLILTGLIIGGLSLQIPGLVLAGVFLLVGFAHQDRMLESVGVFALLGSYSAYYYQLDTNLLVKSAHLLVLGLGLLILRQVFIRQSTAKQSAPQEKSDV